MNKYLIGIPCYNEEGTIGRIASQSKKYGTVMVVDDGSIDGSIDQIQIPDVLVCSFHRNMGYGHVLKTLFEQAKEYDGLITIDGDGQHNPTEIPRFIKALEQNKGDVVLGNRFLSKSSIPPKRKDVIGMFNKLYSVGDSQCGFRAYNKKAIDSIVIREDRMGASLEILKQAHEKNLKVFEVPCTIVYFKHDSDINVRHGLSLVETILWMTVWRKPLLTLGVPSLILLLAGMCSTYMTLTIYASTRVFVQSWLTAMMFCLLSGILLFSTMVIVWAIKRGIREMKL